MDIKYYQIDEVAKLTDITKRTIRYYEDMELLKPARTESSYRLYTEDNIETIKEIKNLRLKLGMNLAEIQNFMGLKKSINEILEGKVRDIHKIAEVKDKIQNLMILVGEKEVVLQKIKNNCNNHLHRFSKIVEELEEE